MMIVLLSEVWMHSTIPLSLDLTNLEEKICVLVSVV